MRLREVSALDIDDATSESTVMGPKSGGTKGTERSTKQHRTPKELTVRHIKEKHDNVAHRQQKSVKNCKYCGAGYLQRVSCIQQDMQRLQEDQPLQEVAGQLMMSDYKPQLMTQDHQDKSFDSVKIKYLYFCNIKSVTFTKLRLKYQSKKGTYNKQK